MTNLIVSIIQTNLHWENSAKNIAHFETKINALAEPTDIIVLP